METHIVVGVFLLGYFIQWSTIVPLTCGIIIGATLCRLPTFDDYVVEVYDLAATFGTEKITSLLRAHLTTPS